MCTRAYIYTIVIYVYICNVYLYIYNGWLLKWGYSHENPFCHTASAYIPLELHITEVKEERWWDDGIFKKKKRLRLPSKSSKHIWMMIKIRQQNVSGMSHWRGRGCDGVDPSLTSKPFPTYRVWNPVATLRTLQISTKGGPGRSHMVHNASQTPVTWGAC